MYHKSRPVFPQDYSGDKAIEYNNIKWMERNQKKTTIKCINYLFDPHLGKYRMDLYKKNIILDLGCGTGFSSEILVERGFRVIGIEILTDMINLAQQKKQKLSLKSLELILADIRHIPLRSKSVDHMISVSAYNFIIEDVNPDYLRKQILNSTAKQLYEILKDGGRLIIEFYPEKKSELERFTSSFVKNQFEGYYIKKQKKKDSKSCGQTYLLMKKVKRAS